MLPIESYKRITNKLTTPDNINLFDWKYYININKDLFQNGITSKDQAYNHWITFGKTENRLHRFMNNLDMYIDNIKDLLNNKYINKERAWDLLDDYTNISDNINDQQIKTIVDNENEKRLNKYKDQKHLNYLEHANFLNFDWEFYIENNKDLLVNKINNKEKAWKHWTTNGKYENRKFKLIEDNMDEQNLYIDKYQLSHDKKKELSKMYGITEINQNDKIDIYEEQQVKNYYLNDDYYLNNTSDKKNYNIQQNSSILHSKIIKDRMIKDKILKYNILKHSINKNKINYITRNIRNNNISNREKILKNKILQNKNKLIKPIINETNNKSILIEEEKNKIEKNKKIIILNNNISENLEKNIPKNNIIKNKLDKKIIINSLEEEKYIENDNIINKPVDLNINIENPLDTSTNIDKPIENKPIENNLNKKNLNYVLKKDIKNNKIDSEILFNKIISNIVNTKIINSKKRYKKL